LALAALTLAPDYNILLPVDCERAVERGTT